MGTGTVAFGAGLPVPVDFEVERGRFPLYFFYIPPAGWANYTYVGKKKGNRHCSELGIFVKISIN
jgi:hypothetical protein